MYEKIQFTSYKVKESTDVIITVPEHAAKHLQDMSTSAQEQFVVLTLNVKNQLIDKHLVSLGTVNSALVHQREIFRPAILDSASSIVIAHNHPTGDPTPSAEDIKITRKMVEAGRQVGISVIDHIIIGKKTKSCEGFFSIRESGLVGF